MTTEEMSPAYARSVGERLRDIRHQQGLSLQAVEATSQREFKASVLGAYERGERIISVLRLQRLARLYGVPVDQLLPKDGTVIREGERGAGRDGGDRGPLTIDLGRLEALDAPERDVLQRYVTMIQLQRGDFNGRVITVRDEDVRSLGRVYERDEAAMRRHLRELGICVEAGRNAMTL